MAEQLVSAMDNGPAPVRSRRRRVRGVDKLGTAIELVGQALAPLTPEARLRVLRATAALFDIALGRQEA